MRHLTPLIVCALAFGCQKPDSPPAVTFAPAPTPAPPIAGEPPPAPAPAPAPAPVPRPAANSTSTYAERTKQFLEAAEKGRVSLLTELARGGVNVNDKDDDGQTALHMAVAKGQKSAVVALLVLGADMSERDGKDRTPLMIAAAEGKEEVLKLLLNPDAVKDLVGDVAGLIGKEFKLDLGKLNIRLSNTSNDARDQIDPRGRTPLMLAAAAGHTDCVNRLMESVQHTTNLERVLRADKKGQNAIMLAAAAGHADVIDALVRRWVYGAITLADMRRTDPDGKSALDLAEAGKHNQAVKLLWREFAVKAAADDDVPTLQSAMEKYPAEMDPPALINLAAAAGAPRVVKYLMEQAKDKSPEDKLRLMNAHGNATDDTALFRAVTSRNLVVIRTLLDMTWWKDKEALLRFVRCKLRTGNWSVLEWEYYRMNYPDQVKLVGELVKEIEAKK